MHYVALGLLYVPGEGLVDGSSIAVRRLSWGHIKTSTVQ